ncbi:hypothetical protein KP509_30G042000 [Ceratopteris richardii]|uniref:Uncharacterized protein n=1 Tax=Ceratopteris richardii TaxID=49495 RepID=A0A8T2R3L5_CERRI|nr:hypothetical protein KP509_30G042000 [Ceratopteris richardii]
MNELTSLRKRLCVSAMSVGCHSCWLRFFHMVSRVQEDDALAAASTFADIECSHGNLQFDVHAIAPADWPDQPIRARASLSTTGLRALLLPISTEGHICLCKCLPVNIEARDMYQNEEPNDLHSKDQHLSSTAHAVASFLGATTSGGVATSGNQFVRIFQLCFNAFAVQITASQSANINLLHEEDASLRNFPLVTMKNPVATSFLSNADTVYSRGGSHKAKVLISSVNDRRISSDYAIAVDIAHGSTACNQTTVAYQKINALHVPGQ